MKARWLLGLLPLLCWTPAWANVSLKNGNFFIGYTDIIYSGGFEPKIERVYNSKSPFKGIFGWGWGGELEVYLVAYPSGVIVIHEYGGGAENLFAPAQLTPALVEKEVLAISAAALANGSVRPGAPLEAYRVRLRNDQGLRQDEWNRFLSLRLVEAPSLPVGTVVSSQRFAFQYVTRTRSGYVRVVNGREEHFDPVSGKLLRVVDHNNNFIEETTYDASGRFNRIADNYGRFMKFFFNVRGFVERIEDERGRAVTYQYDELDDLVRSRDVDGNVYQYEYDRRHNMRTIRYDDKTTMEMTYDFRDRQENVKEVKDRDGTRTSYDYVSDPKDRGHHKISVEVRSPEEGTTSKSSYEYFLKRDENGTEWTARMITDLDGDVNDTVYQKGSDLPLSITRGGETTAFKYDDEGHVTRKETKTEITELEYDPQVHKVSRVKHQTKGSSEIEESRFEYDAKGNLSRAEDSKGRSVRLEYDEQGRISAVTNKQKQRLEVTYNRQSKPELIRVVNVGALKTTYDADGNILRVENLQENKVSTVISSFWQELQEVIRPAGVSLSF